MSSCGLVLPWWRGLILPWWRGPKLPDWRRSIAHTVMRNYIPTLTQAVYSRSDATDLCFHSDIKLNPPPLYWLISSQWHRPTYTKTVTKTWTYTVTQIYNPPSGKDMYLCSDTNLRPYSDTDLYPHSDTDLYPHSDTDLYPHSDTDIQ